MRKILALLLVLVTLTNSLTDKEILQQGLNGLFEQNKLPDSATIIPCLDDATAHRVVEFVTDSLKKAAKGSVADLISLVGDLKKFVDSLPEPVKTCLANNQDLKTFGLKYGITPETDPQDIAKKIIAYATLHYLQVHKWFGSLNDLWQGGKYYQTGFDGAGYLHNVFPTGPKSVKLSDREILQQGLNGFFKENNLNEPTSFVACFDDESAHKTVAFVSAVLPDAASSSVQQLINTIPETKQFYDDLPESVKHCLHQDKEGQALAAKYGITSATSQFDIEKTLITYATLHFLSLHKWFGHQNDLWQAQQYEKTGYDGAAFLHNVFHATQQVPNLTDKEIIQQTLNGAFEQNKLPDPTTIVPCIDDNTAHKIVKFIGQLLEKAAKGSVSDLISLKKLVEDFGKEIPQSVKDCLDGNKQFEALGLKYGIDNNTNSSAVEKKVIQFVTLHYLEVHKTFGDLNSAWKAEKYKKTGNDAAVFGHKILKMSKMPKNIRGGKDSIQQGLNGLFEVNKLPDPKTIVPCLDDKTADSIIDFGGKLLAKACSASIADFAAIVKMIQDFGDTIPQAVKDCLDGNKELEALGLKYGITNETDPSVIEKKVLTYVTLHYLEVHKQVCDLSDLYKAGKYKDVGTQGGAYAHKILGGASEIPNPTDKEIIQQGLNGVFEQNKLPDPTTIVPCIDDDTAHKIVVFAGQLLEKAAKGSVQDLIALKKLIEDFGDQIPQSVKDCLDGNKQLEALGLKYGIDNNTNSSAVEKKVIAYVTLHYLEVHKTFGDLNNNWKAGKYYQTGFNAAAFGHKILGSAEKPKNIRGGKDSIQQGLNGLFEVNKLPDPKTIVPCLDDKTADSIIDFGGKLLAKACSASIADFAAIVKMIQDFGDTIPQAVKDCLDGNKELEALGLKYGITPDTDPSVIEKKVLTYVTLHYLEVHKQVCDLSDLYKAGKYKDVGSQGGAYAHKILGMAMKEILNLSSE